MHLSRGKFRAALASAALAVAVCAAGRTAGAAEKSAAGVLKDGKPLGLFFMTRYWSSTHTLEKAVWYFTADEQVYLNPTAGVSPADLKAHKGRAGTFQVSGDDLEVAWADGRKSRSKLEPDKDNAFGWDAGLFSPALPIRDAASVAGSYEGGESLIHGDDKDANKVIVSKTLELRRDGTFELEGVAFLKGGDETGGSSQEKTEGTWEAGGYTLTFKLAGGNAARRLAFPVDDEYLYVGGLVFKRHKEK